MTANDMAEIFGVLGGFAALCIIPAAFTAACIAFFAAATAAESAHTNGGKYER